MPRHAQRIPIKVEEIPAESTAYLRHRILWPSVPFESQLLQYDWLPTTQHFGAFLLDSQDLSPELRQSIDERYLPLPPNSDPSGSTRLQAPIGHLTITLEDYSQPERLPPDLQSTRLKHYQLHKFAVLELLQGYGIGRALVETAIRAIAPSPSDGQTKNGVLLHLDSRKEQRGLYETLGFHCLDEEIFIKRGPTGNGPPSEYVRMGRVLSEVMAYHSQMHGW